MGSQITTRTGLDHQELFAIVVGFVRRRSEPRHALQTRSSSIGPSFISRLPVGTSLPVFLQFSA